ncbi:hypothetical protein DYB25_007377 [Aphanomyces astaci]|uniref:Uncharacterized protein n=1 Tax=Aphanomyces astaci TaxID=112090 RepID=A0A397BHU5_APHAT|nr:hypothetical protein DYB25_007377 [Aphanomyces astaci]RHZ06900.1 hypothetical protein DYB31_014924 [Aphanomyces astaci]
MKTTVVWSVMAMASANQHKITPSVIESLQQSSTVTVFVAIGELFGLQNRSRVYDVPKCNRLRPISGVFQCDDLAIEEINRLAALPEVREILSVADNSVPDPPNIAPKPVVLSDVDVANQQKIGPGVLQSLQQSPTVTVNVAFHGSPPHSKVYDFVKCNRLPPIVDLPDLTHCNNLTMEEIYSVAALPEVREILSVADNSVPDPPNIAPKPVACKERLHLL